MAHPPRGDRAPWALVLSIDRAHVLRPVVAQRNDPGPLWTDLECVELWRIAVGHERPLVQPRPGMGHALDHRASLGHVAKAAEADRGLCSGILLLGDIR